MLEEWTRQRIEARDHGSAVRRTAARRRPSSPWRTRAGTRTSHAARLSARTSNTRRSAASAASARRSACPTSPGGPRRPRAAARGAQLRRCFATSAGARALPGCAAGAAGPSRGRPQDGRADLPARPACASPTSAGAGSGPWSGQTLAFLGAEVYKIESRARVDINRNMPPFAGGVRDPGPQPRRTTPAGPATAASRSNLKQPEASELARELGRALRRRARELRPRRDGAARPRLRAAARGESRDLVMVSMPAAGLFGPAQGHAHLRHQPERSLTGLDSVTGYLGRSADPDGERLRRSRSAASSARFAVLLATAPPRPHRRRASTSTSRSRRASCSWSAPAFMDYVLNGRVAGPIGNRHPLGAAAPHGVFPCRATTAGSPSRVAERTRNGAALVARDGQPAPGRRAPALRRRRRARRAPSRRSHERLAGLDARTATTTSSRERLQRPASPRRRCSNVADLLHDPHYRARGTFVEVQHPLGFPETIYGAYVKTSRSRRRRSAPGPAIGQDNEHVFRELLGISPERLAALVAPRRSSIEIEARRRPGFAAPRPLLPLEHLDRRRLSSHPPPGSSSRRSDPLRRGRRPDPATAHSRS